jgi:hypothetical protein
MNNWNCQLPSQKRPSGRSINLNLNPPRALPEMHFQPQLRWQGKAALFLSAIPAKINSIDFEITSDFTCAQDYTYKLAFQDVMIVARSDRNQ